MERSDYLDPTRIAERVQDNTSNLKCAVAVRSLENEYKFSPTIRDKVDDLVARKLTVLRKVRGDGNCFYRSVGYAYIELLIVHGPEALRDFIRGLKEPDKYTTLNAEAAEMEILVGCVSELISAAEARRDTLRKLLGMVLLNECFDHALIRYMRRLAYNFIQNNRRFAINGLPIEEIVGVESETLDSYSENVILKQYEDARHLVFSILPLVLRVNLCIMLLDMKDKKVKQTVKEVYPAKVENFAYFKGDTLDLQQDTIYVLLKPGHYDILYKDEYYKTELMEYDWGYVDKLLPPQQVNNNNGNPKGSHSFITERQIPSPQKLVPAHPNSFVHPANLLQGRSPSPVPICAAPAEDSKQVADQDLCIICFQLASVGPETITLECGHRFHLGCIWTLTSGRKTLQNCPVAECRKKVTKDDARELCSAYKGMQHTFHGEVCPICGNEFGNVTENGASHCQSRFCHVDCVIERMRKENFECVVCHQELTDEYIGRLEKVTKEREDREELARHVMARRLKGKNMLKAADEEKEDDTRKLIYKNEMVLSTHCTSCGEYVKESLRESEHGKDKGHLRCPDCLKSKKECVVCQKIDTSCVCF